jgi:hypothetical protein
MEKGENVSEGIDRIYMKDKGDFDEMSGTFPY